MAALSACGVVLPGLRSSLVPAAASRSSDAASCSSTSAACAVKSSASARRGGISAGSCSLQQRGAPACSSGFKGLTLPIVSTSSSTSRASRRAPLSARSALVQKVTAKELDDILTNARTSPMIIDFYATWCGPCIVLAQQLEQLAVEYGDDVRFLKVDTDEEHELATQMEIRGLPTMVFVSSDTEKLAIRTEGLLPTETIRNIIEKEL
ncbi:hypothetical protein MPTK1_3g08100 [Marchantia polymorpha subsp. ruderalis]|uniref:Thioredoxin domain-containing protein n=2 Tax=Marchantia polymorpha TaxID=3197 RepID=A0AAF6AYK8_MARPO|nr:hypothetical protein MARPO_0006s0285 [Marchantia polymorpha]BBN04842.1 hypothetical protein Mp_3g08100 [Marchantia polymorpha subsp. ruderalis]|eukprot:PTQ48294.1 hypothetical protein MARPO_0006s0285 [Marchantia polymorpha]